MSSSSSPEPTGERPTTKRKRPAPSIPEIAVDITLPEPPSKKAKRKEKKALKPGQSITTTTASLESGIIHPSRLATTAPGLAVAYSNSDTSQFTTQQTSPHGIWIGNLPFTCTRDRLRTFLLDHGGIDGKEIVRLHLPAPTKGGRPKQKNRGFAYVDFSAEEIVKRAVALSEVLMDGRRVLIKSKDDFAGRPEKTAAKAEGEEGKEGGKTPTKRVFVGNLGFDVTREDLREFFAPAGEVEDVFLATFEDSGKCKGFGWVTFGSVEAAGWAVKGFVMREPEEVEEEEKTGSDDGDGRDESEEKEVKEKAKKAKKEKIWMNRIHGRTLRCEFAEDAQTRYKKRYGKDSKDGKESNNPNKRGDPDYSSITPNNHTTTAASVSIPTPPDDTRDTIASLATAAAAARTERAQQKPSRGKQDKDQRRAERSQRHIDARTIAPGKALAGTQRATGAIVQGKGRKVVFEE